MIGMEEKIELFLKDKLSKEESEKFIELFNVDSDFRERVISSAILLKSLRNVGKELDKDTIHELYDDIIDEYFKGNLSEKDSSTFKSLLNNNAELRERTVSKALLLKSIKKVGKEKDLNTIFNIKINHHHIGIGEPAAASIPNRDNNLGNQNKQRNTLNFIVKFSTAIAACLCILFGVDYQIAKNNTLSLNYKYSSLGIGCNIDGAYKSADDQKQSKVEMELDSIFDMVRDNMFVEENICSLSRLYINSQSETYNEYVNFREEISFYLALSYLQDNNREKAIEILSNLVEYNPEFREANELLHEIKKIKGLW